MRGEVLEGQSIFGYRGSVIPVRIPVFYSFWGNLPDGFPFGTPFGKAPGLSEHSQVLVN